MARYTLPVLGLYFYRARRASLTTDADLRDSSCRPDPDFEWLTLGLCRPGLRKKIAGLAAADPVDLLFYARVPSTDTLLLVALLRIATVHVNHFEARAGFQDGLPRNLVVPGNPCSCGTVVDPASGHVTMRRRTGICGCHRYVKRAGTPYLQFVTHEPGSLRVADPVPIQWEHLRVLSPQVIGRRWSGADFAGFQRATQNGAHWIADPDEAEAIRHHFLGDPRWLGPSAPAKGRKSIAGIACGPGRTIPRLKATGTQPC